MNALGKRAEKKSNFFVTTIFILAVIGAVMSSGGYRFGEEAITGNAVATSSTPVNYGFFGIILAFVALIALVSIGLVAFSNKRKTVETTTAIPELKQVNKEIDALSQRLNELNVSFRK